jgi:RNA polymerase sigma-70 factor (ECF subfamily)
MDTDAFDRAWRTAQPAVATVLAAHIRDPHVVDDLVQEVAARAWANLTNWDPGRPFTGWVIGIARHVGADWLQARYRSPGTVEPGALAAIAVAAEELAEELEQREQALHTCLDRLPAASRRIIQLHYADGMAPGAIAERLRLNANQIRVALHRLRAALRRCIERTLGEPSS